MAYCGKENGTKVYKLRHYLLNSLKEIVSIYNEEHPDEKPTTYYQVRDIMEKEKHIVLQNVKPDNDCRCELCENAELLLDAAKSHLKKNGKADIAKALLPTPIEILESNVCSVKNQECMNDECINCSRSNAFDDALEALEDLKEVTFYVWRTKDKKI